MAFSKGDEVYVSSKKRKYRGLVSAVDGSSVDVLVGPHLIRCAESDCTAVPAEEKKFDLTPPTAAPGITLGPPSQDQNLAVLLSSEGQAARTARKDAVQALVDTANAATLTPPE